MSLLGKNIAQRVATRMMVAKPQMRSGATLSHKPTMELHTERMMLPEDMLFAKRAIGGSIVGGSGVFVASKWWKKHHGPPTAEELAALGEIHIGHIRGNTRDLAPPERFNGIGIEKNTKEIQIHPLRTKKTKTIPLERRTTTQNIKAHFFRDSLKEN